MRCLLSAALFLTASSALALPQGITIERQGAQYLAKAEGPMLKNAHRLDSVDGTWASSLQIGNEFHNFTIEMGQFPGSDGYIQSLLFRQNAPEFAPYVANGFVFNDGDNFLVFPKWGDDSYFCNMARADDKYVAHCQGNQEAILTMKKMSADQPFRFRPVVATVSTPPRKDPDTGYLMFSSYQSAVERNAVATLDGTDIFYMNFDLTFDSANNHQGIGGVFDLKRALDDPEYATIAHYLSTLDGRYARLRFASATKVVKLSASPLVIHMSDEESGLHYTISEPEN